MFGVFSAREIFLMAMSVFGHIVVQKQVLQSGCQFANSLKMSIVTPALSFPATADHIANTDHTKQHFIDQSQLQLSFCRCVMILMTDDVLKAPAIQKSTKSKTSPAHISQLLSLNRTCKAYRSSQSYGAFCIASGSSDL
jgi:hypothetical protein